MITASQKNNYSLKKTKSLFVDKKKKEYLCRSYPENNLFTLKKLMPIERIKGASL